MRGDKRVLDTQIELLKLERVKTGVFRVDDISNLSPHITLEGVEMLVGLFVGYR